MKSDIKSGPVSVKCNEYITERDFVTIKSFGLNAIRIPIPYFIFGDCPPFIGCIEELDKGFNWAEKYGLKILIDLHTVPGSQNGFDNGGICGVCKWSQQPESLEFTLKLLERLSERYGKREGLWGIQIVNEPITEELWNLMDIQSRYKPVDSEMATGSAPATFAFLKEFYVEAYHRIRKFLPEDKFIVFHDGFDIKKWKDFMRDEEFKNVVLDTHQYLMMAEMSGCEQCVEGYVQYIEGHYAKDIEEMQEYFPVICGEWCLFNSLACGSDTKGGQSPLNGKGSFEDEVPNEEKKEIYTKVAEAQLNAWAKGSGYFYWNYKLLLDTVNDLGWIGWDAWDLGRCVAQGWFPVQD